MIKHFFSLLYSVTKIDLKLIKGYPRIFIPLAIRALISLLFLSVLYVAPYYPFKKILGPLIIEHYGSQYLHYPNNFTIMPVVFTNLKNFIVNPLFSSVMIAICCGMVYDYHIKREPGFWRNFNKAARRFWPLFLSMLFLVCGSYLIYRFTPGFIANIFGDMPFATFFLLFIPFIFLIIFETFFLFCFVAIMTKKQGIVSALKNSVRFSRGLFPVAFILVFMPRLLDFFMSLALSYQKFFSELFVPDISLLLIIFSILTAVISDTLVFSLTANLYLLNEK